MIQDPSNLKWVIPASTLFLDDLPEEDWLVDRILPLNGNCVLAADPKAGKSELALEIAICVATGFPVMDIFYPTQPGPVLYVAAEGRRKKLRDRANALAKPRGVTMAAQPIDFVFRDAGFRIDTEEWKKAITAQVQKSGYRLIVIDTFASVHFANENAQQEVTPMLQFLDYLTEHHHTTVLLLHHLRKKSSNPKSEEDSLSLDRLRGSGTIRGWYDTGILVSGEDLPDHAGKVVTLARDHRDSDDNEPFRALMKISKGQAHWSVYTTEMPHRDARILRALTKGRLTEREISQATNIDNYKILDKRLYYLAELELLARMKAPSKGAGRGRPSSDLYELTPRGWFSATGKVPANVLHGGVR